MNDSTPRPPRRPRYPGKNPRRFEDKYKEHQPERYGDEVAHIIASGKTPAGTHRPIMVSEILNVLKPRPGELAVDCTLGYGGHSRELLSAIQPGGRLIGIDADPIELPKTHARLKSLGFPVESFVAVRTNFAGLSRTLAEHAPGGVDLLLADLGVSSMQIDNPARGFSYKQDGQLDMRMNPQRGKSAAEWLSSVEVGELAECLEEYADEPNSQVLAHAIVEATRRSSITTTTQLADVIKRTLGRIDESEVSSSIQRVFQAIRIAINEELSVLDSLLRQIPDCLKPGGRAAILTFHSGEDRRVKQAFKDGLAMGRYSAIAPDVIRASFDEQRANPRAAPAKLRWAVK